MLLHRLRRRAGLLPALVLPLLVFAPASGADTGFKRDRTPLPADLTGSGGSQAAAQGSSTSGAAVHMLFALALVLVLIYALYRLLKRSSSKSERKMTIRGDDWMSVIASTPLAPSRSVHLIRVGEEIVLVGAGEQGVTPIRVYSADEARELRIEPGEPPALGAGPPGGPEQGFLASLLESLRKRTAR